MLKIESFERALIKDVWFMEKITARENWELLGEAGNVWEWLGKIPAVPRKVPDADFLSHKERKDFKTSRTLRTLREISSVGEDAREPAVRSGFTRSEDFGGFRRKRPTRRASRNSQLVTRNLDQLPQIVDAVLGVVERAAFNAHDNVLRNRL